MTSIVDLMKVIIYNKNGSVANFNVIRGIFGIICIFGEIKSPFSV